MKKPSAVEWAMKQVLPPSQALVLRTLARRAGIRSGSWKTQDQLAAESNGISLSTFKRKLGELIELGLVTISKKRGVHHLVCEYHFDLTRLVRWDRKEMKWSAFLRREIAHLRERERLPNESKEAFVRRQVQRLSTPGHLAASVQIPAQCDFASQVRRT